METIRINATDDTPNVVLDPEKSHFEISGRSLPEDVVVFYQPVMQWLEQLQQKPIRDMNLVIKLEYFNTASSKLILDILLKLEDIFQDGTPVKVTWCYLASDADMREAGEEYSEIVGLPFSLSQF